MALPEHNSLKNHHWHRLRANGYANFFSSIISLMGCLNDSQPLQDSICGISRDKMLHTALLFQAVPFSKQRLLQYYRLSSPCVLQPCLNQVSIRLQLLLKVSLHLFIRHACPISPRNLGIFQSSQVLSLSDYFYNYGIFI